MKKIKIYLTDERVVEFELDNESAERIKQSLCSNEGYINCMSPKCLETLVMRQHIKVVEISEVEG